MITTKRPIISEQDRYGGYAVRASNRTVSSDKDEIVSYSKQDRGHDFSLINAESDVVRYSARPTARTDSDIEQSQMQKERPRQSVYVPPQKISEYKYQKREREDIMPNIKREQAISENAQKNEHRESMSFKTKVMLSVYIAVVVMLAAIVLATGYAINNAKSNVDGLENELAVKSQIVISQESRLAMYEDATYNTGRATENGMEKIDDYTELEMGKMLEPITYEERTNWFDKFCNFLSKISGD